MTRDPVDDALAALAATEPPPPMSAELASAVESTRAVRPRNPRRQLAAIAAIGLGYAAGWVALLGVRGDLEQLPRVWLIAYLAAWLIGFGLALRVALVPPRGHVMPRGSASLWIAVVASVGFVFGGLLGVPGASRLHDVPTSSVIAAGFGCFAIGLATAAVPVALAVFALRGAAPVRSTAVAAALGAAGGCLGGLTLHLHCPIAERFHLGLIHGGIVVVAAVAAAAVAARWLAIAR